MKFLGKFIKYFFAALAGLVALAYIFDYGYLFKGLAKTYFRGQTSANIDDASLFPSHTIVAGDPKPWIKDGDFNKKHLPHELTSELKRTKTAAFVVVKDGKLLHEEYFNGYSAQSKTNSFSMAKTITSLLMGIAIADGKIKDDDEKFSDFYPYFENSPYGKALTLRDLVTMEAGLDWDENYKNPFKPNARAYYGNSLADAVFSRKFKEKPGTHFEYQSGATQILGFAVKKAVQQPLASYLSEKLWTPLHMEQNALWTTDERGMEKTFCCIYSNAKDFAKLGQLLLDDGKVNGQQIISPDYMKKLMTPTSLSNGVYSYALWFNQDAKYKHYFYLGMLGQYIIVVPEKNLVIVRLGNNQNDEKDTKGRPTQTPFIVNQIIDHFL